MLPPLSPSTSFSAEPLAWGAQALWEDLRALLPGLSVEVVPRAASTNSVLLERARVSDTQILENGRAELQPAIPDTAFGRRSVDWQPCLLVAEHQTGGRGRLGRTWHAAPGASLTFSLALPMAPVSWSGLSLAVGVALAEALEPPHGHAPSRLGLKWPNDLWLRDAPGAASSPEEAGGTALGRKLGGILVETVSASAKRLAVIGVGLNVRPLDTGLTGGLSVACVDELYPGISVPEVLATVAVPLVRALHLFEREGFSPFMERFAARDCLLGRQVVLNHADVREGRADGVAADGALRVQAAQGLSVVHSGEVSVRLQQQPATAADALASEENPV
ncbi:MAG: biotin--[acetyl-CoA-carboxylase] ligase [Pseudomonadota bacterium]